MQRYFVNEEEFNKLELVNDFHHIKNVMRMKIQDKIIINYNSKSYITVIKAFQNQIVFVEIVEEIKNNSKSPVNITILQGIPKGDKLETIAQKTTELGIDNLYYTNMVRSIAKFNDDKISKKLERLNKIVKEASEQSHRNTIPNVKIYKKINDLDYSIYDSVIVLDEEKAKNAEKSNFKQILINLKLNDSILIVIGPEGGLARDEVKFFNDLPNTTVCAIGPRILRTETASNYVLSAISYEMELT